MDSGRAGCERNVQPVVHQDFRACPLHGVHCAPYDSCKRARLKVLFPNLDPIHSSGRRATYGIEQFLH